MAVNKKVYQSCDRAIKAMDRENVEAFGRLKMAKWDELHIIRTVVAVYTQSAKRARKRYFGVAWDAYLIGLMLCEIDAAKAQQMARKDITLTWVDDILERVDPVTQFRFDKETDRKAYRLAETLEVTTERQKAVGKALRDWSRQLGQYAINFTDYAMIKAFEDAGIKQVMWVTQRDERVCGECDDLDGQIFDVDKVPPKPHWGCRCELMPVME